MATIPPRQRVGERIQIFTPWTYAFENSYGRGSSADYLTTPVEYFDTLQSVSVTYENPSYPDDPDNGTRSFSRISARSLRSPYTWNPPQGGTPPGSYDAFIYPSPPAGKFCALLFNADGFAGSGNGYIEASKFRQVPTRPSPILIFGSDQATEFLSAPLNVWFGLTFRLSLAMPEGPPAPSPPPHVGFGGTQYGAVQVAAHWQMQNYQCDAKVSIGGGSGIITGVGPLPDPFNWRDIRGSYDGGRLEADGGPLGWSFVLS